jgi:anti-anti-sigma factor
MEANNGGLRLRVEQTGQSSPVLRVGGEVDIATAPELNKCLDELDGNVVVDLTDVTFLDSSGIRVLVVARKQLVREGGSLTLRNPNDLVSRTLEIMGLRDWVEE